MDERRRQSPESKPDPEMELLLSYKNPNDEKYQKLLYTPFRDDDREHVYTTEYSQTWWNFIREEEKTILNEKLRDSILVDLGAGIPVDNRSIAQLVAHAGVKTYIQVDRFFPRNKKYDVNKPYEIESGKGSRVARFKADMLDFTSHLKSDSVNFVINGIFYGGRVPDGGHPSLDAKVDKYDTFLAEEMVRATKKGGIIFGNASDVLAKLSKMNELAILSEQRIMQHQKLIFEKK